MIASSTSTASMNASSTSPAAMNTAAMNRVSRYPSWTRRLGVVLGVWFWASLCWVPVAQGEKLVVHLPSHVAENEGVLAEALDRLAAHLSAGLDGVELQPEIFRRVSDMEAFLTQSSDTTLLLTDASFLVKAPLELEPLQTFSLGGENTYRRVVVVPAEADTQRLADLRGQELTVVQTAVDNSHLKSEIFAGELDPETYFSGLRAATEDTDAVTDLLFGQSSAALVAEDIPLLKSNLDTKLRVVYRSKPLARPVISAPKNGLSPAQRQAVEEALSSLEPGSASWLAALGIDSFQKVDPKGQDRGGKTGQRSFGRALSVPYQPNPLPLPKPDSIPFPLILELPESTPIGEKLLTTREKP